MRIVIRELQHFDESGEQIYRAEGIPVDGRNSIRGCSVLLEPELGRTLHLGEILEVTVSRVTLPESWKPFIDDPIGSQAVADKIWPPRIAV